MYVLTTEPGTLGAAALFYPEVKEKAAELIGSGYYILPSSVHEVILVPDTVGHNEKELCDMVKQANRTVVEPQEVLSDNVYHFDRDSRILSRVDPEREKADRVAEAVLFSVLACGVAVGIYLGLSPILGTETTSWLCIVAAFPFA